MEPAPATPAPANATAKPRLLQKLYWFTFVVTFVFITVLVYGYALILRETLHDHDLSTPTTSTIGSEATQTQGIGGVAPSPLPRHIADSLQRAAIMPVAPTPRETQGYERHSSPNRPDEALSANEVVSGTLAGDPYATAQSYIAVGLFGTILFGAISAGLYMVSSRGDFKVAPPQPRPRGPRAYAPPLEREEEA